MNKELKEELKIKKIEIVLQCAKELGNDAEICRDFHINRSSFYFWKKRYEKDGIDGNKIVLSESGIIAKTQWLKMSIHAISSV